MVWVLVNMHWTSGSYIQYKIQAAEYLILYSSSTPTNNHDKSYTDMYLLARCFVLCAFSSLHTRNRALPTPMPLFPGR